MNKQKTILSISLLLLSIIFMFNFVSAIQFQAPISHTNHSSAITVGIKFVNGTDITDPLSANTTFYYNASGQVAWTSVTCGSVTTTNTSYNCSIAITAIPDNATISLNVTLGSKNNASGNRDNMSNVVGRITVDDTDPICTTGDALLQRNNIEIGTTNSLICSCTDNIDSAPSTTRNLTKPGNTLVSITKSPYSTALSDTNKIGTYTFACGAIDYSLNGDTNTKTFRVDSDDDVTSTTPTIIDSSISSKRNIFLIGGLVFLVIIIGGIAIAFGMSSGGKKRRY